MQATTVAAQGSAETDFNLAGFSLSLSAEGATSHEAKVGLKKQVDQLMAALDSMKAKLSLEFVKNSVQAISNVQENWQYVANNREFHGYIATYQYSFQIDDLDKVSQVHDTLTSLDEASVSSPSFALKSRDRINKKALKDAFAKVKDRFETECNVLGLNPADFEIASWEATYSDSHRSDRVSATTRRASGMSRGSNTDGLESAIASAQCAPSGPMGGGGPANDPLEIVVGKAKVTANLEVGFARKVSQTIKAKLVKESPLSEELTHV